MYYRVACGMNRLVGYGVWTGRTVKRQRRPVHVIDREATPGNIIT